MILETVCVGSLEVNCYILAEGDGFPAIIIDPGDEANKIRQVLSRHKLKPALVINTHGHIDHIGADDEWGVPIYIHRQDAVLLKDTRLNLSSFLAQRYCVKSKMINLLEDGQSIELGKLRLKVMHTPGHTPGGICLLMQEPQNKILFTGDTLFCQSIGRTDLEGADEHTLIDAIKDKLLKLSDDTVIYPGHGPSSSIGEEKRNNPFLI
ncbi:MAG: MBL fold metallo-hydrolase [Candidatus Omnitrophica bacterium]|nr:MBL fold metallo-hydrolase [Candidatus Omnitrophota bacterium]